MTDYVIFLTTSCDIIFDDDHTLKTVTKISVEHEDFFSLVESATTRPLMSWNGLVPITTFTLMHLPGTLPNRMGRGLTIPNTVRISYCCSRSPPYPTFSKT